MPTGVLMKHHRTLITTREKKNTTHKNFQILKVNTVMAWLLQYQNAKTMNVVFKTSLRKSDGELKRITEI